MNSPTYYQILGIERDATILEIKKAFRKLALKYHPDQNNKEGSESKFIRINEAYIILKDPKARKRYDATLPKIDSEFNKNHSDIDSNDDDQNLENWKKQARDKASAFSNMDFEEFEEIVLESTKEAVNQFVNVLLLFLGLILTISGLGILIPFYNTNINITNNVLGILLLPVGFWLIIHVNNKWDDI